MTLCYEYDALNRLRYVREDQTTPKDCAGTLAWRVTHEYDTLNFNTTPPNGIGRRNRLVDGSGSTVWEYDARGRATKETKTIGATSFVTQWTYDAADRVQTMTYPLHVGGGTTAETVTYGYNAQGLEQQAVGTYSYASAMQYTALGQLSSYQTNGALRTLSFDYYDDAGESKSFRLQRILSSAANEFDREYVYDNAGNVITLIDRAFANLESGPTWQTTTQTHTFVYDDLNRLKSGVTAGGFRGYNESYDYAANGNMISFKGLAATYGNQDDALCGNSSVASDKPHALVGYNGELYCYDKNGNQITRKFSAETWRLTYDAENHLTKVEKQPNGGVWSTVADYLYDGDGQRVKAVVNGATTHYVGKHYEHSVGSSVCASANSNKCDTRYYFVGGRLVGFFRNNYLSNNGQRFVFSDHLGSTNLVINGAGTKLWADYFTPYGGWHHTWENPATIPLQTTYRFTGQRHQPETMLYDYGARWYDNRRGRFIQPDTIVPEPGNPQSLNRYAYTLNNPVRYTDPTGQAECASEDCVVRVHPKTKQPIGMRQKWGIFMAGSWEAEKAWMVYEGVRSISERVGNHLGGDALTGDSWIQKNLGGTVFQRWPNDAPFSYDDGVNRLYFKVHPAITAYQIYHQTTEAPAGVAFPKSGKLFSNPTIHFFDDMWEGTPVHELGHIIDYSSQSASAQMTKMVSPGSSPTAYGKTDRLEDFAESWALWVYDPSRFGTTVAGQQRLSFISSLVVNGMSK